MLQFITVFDPTKSTDETDTYKQLLIFHNFEDVDLSLNDKLGKISMMHGLFLLTNSSPDSKSNNERVIESDNETILVIRVEDQFFIGLSFVNNSTNSREPYGTISYHYYLAHLWYSYEFFTLFYGTFSKFNDPSKLTDCLNEQLISFWNEIYKNPECMKRKGLSCMWPFSHRISNLEANNIENSWESIMNKEILLDPESYLGIKDILVYHLPNLGLRNIESTKKKNIRTSSKTYGLVRNFSANFKSLGTISNWIYHLHSVYDCISSEALTSNNNYRGECMKSHSTFVRKNNVENEPIVTNNENDNEQEINSEQTENQLPPDTLNFSMQAKQLLHNMALPITFSYDVVQEVGATTGVSNSMSLVTNYLPFFNNSNNNYNGELNSINDGNVELKEKNYGYLISPTYPESHPNEFKVKEMILDFSQDDNDDINNEVEKYNVIFWYYQSTLVVIICKSTFNKIWEIPYLNKLEEKLIICLDRFYDTMFNEELKNGVIGKNEDFGYLHYKKDKLGGTINISIPSWVNMNDMLKYNNETEIQSVVVDDDTNENENVEGVSNWKFGNMIGTYWNNNNNKKVTIDKDIINEEEEEEKSDRILLYGCNFLDYLEDARINELNIQLEILLMNQKNMSRKINGIIEERLTKINNGIICFLRENENEFLLIIQNWFDDKIRPKIRKGNYYYSDMTSSLILIDSLSKEVREKFS